MVPSKVFFTKGTASHKHYLTSFEFALRDAGIAPFNHVMVSSIYPPNVKRITREEGLKFLKPGSIVFTVMARNATNEPNRLIAASVGAAIPAEAGQYGYLSEHHPFGETEEKAGETAEDLAAQMLASTLGIDLDPGVAWDEREHQYKASGKIIRTFNVTQSAEGHKDGLWTTVLAAAVFIFDTVEIPGAGQVLKFLPHDVNGKL